MQKLDVRCEVTVTDWGFVTCDLVHIIFTLKFEGPIVYRRGSEKQFIAKSEKGT
jgi:hypothetical protein